MDTLPFDILEIILSMVPDSTLLTMQRDRQIRQKIRTVYKSNTFWKKKVEVKLKRNINISVFKWKNVYYHIGKDLNKTFLNAIDTRNIDLVKVLLTQPGVNPAHNHNIAVKKAIDVNCIEIVKLLAQDPRVDVTVESNRPLYKALRNRSVDIVKFLLNDKRINESCNHDHVISHAAMYGMTEVVRLLIGDPRVDPSVKDNYVIKHAIKYGHVDVVKIGMQSNTDLRSLLEDPRVDPSVLYSYPKKLLMYVCNILYIGIDSLYIF